MPERVTGWHVDVDRETCMGSGMCIVYAPSTFAHDEESKAVVMVSSQDTVETVRVAANACPMSALSVVET